MNHRKASRGTLAHRSCWALHDGDMLALNGRVHVSHEVRLYRVRRIVGEGRKPIWGRQDEAVVCCHEWANGPWSAGRRREPKKPATRASNYHSDRGTATRLDNVLTAHQRSGDRPTKQTVTLNGALRRW